MDTIRICVYDKEEAFASRLAVMLDRKGSGRYKVSAFDDLEKLQLDKRGFQIYIGDCRAVMEQLKETSIVALHLSEMEEERLPDLKGYLQISKYAGAKKICQMVEQMTRTVEQHEQETNKVIAMYSPVGRCGKTQFALSLSSAENSWFYVGLEDYGVVVDSLNPAMEYSAANAFMYYIKERNAEKLMEILEEEKGVIPSLFSPMDSKALNEDDWKWIVGFFRNQSKCKRVVLDIGTGVLGNLQWLVAFDCVVVPFLSNEIAIRKKEKWQHLLASNGLEILAEKCIYINMSKTEEIEEQRKRLQGVTT